MLDVLLVSAKASTKIVVICAAGSYLERAGIFTKDIRKGVSEAFVKLLLPCLLFTRILPTISAQTIPIMAWLAFANIVYVVLGFALGKTMVCSARPAPHLRSILSLVPAIGHANSIPFLLLPLLCREYEGFREGDAEKAQGYLGLYLVMHSITLWGVGLNVIKKEKDSEPSSSSAPAPASGSASGGSSQRDPPPQLIGSALGGDGTGAAALPGLAADGAPAGGDSAAGIGAAGPRSAGLAGLCDAFRRLFAAVLGLDVRAGPGRGGAPAARRSGAEEAGEARDEVWADSVTSLETGVLPPTSGRSLLCKPDSLMRFVPKWLNRPVLAALVACVLGLSPGVKEVLASPDGAVNFAFSAMDTLGQAGSVIALLGVGALFTADGVPKPSAIGYRPLLGVLLSRLVLLPLCALPLWVLLRRVLPFFPDERVFMLVMCIECCTPSAYNLVTMCILQGRNPADLAAALFYQNLVAIFTLTGWVTVILYYVV